MDHATMADWYYDESRDDRNEGFCDGESLGLDPEDELSPLELLRSTGPHAGLAAMSGELWQAWLNLPPPERQALALRDSRPAIAEEVLAEYLVIWRPMDVSRGDALLTARAALRRTRGILDPINGKVTR